VAGDERATVDDDGDVGFEGPALLVAAGEEYAERFTVRLTYSGSRRRSPSVSMAATSRSTAVKIWLASSGWRAKRPSTMPVAGLCRRVR
jgi:hypothetical protein